MKSTPDPFLPGTLYPANVKGESSSHHGILADPLQAIISITTEVVLGDGLSGGWCINYIARRSTLATLILSRVDVDLKRAEAIAGSEQFTITIPWSDWGPDCVRWRYMEDIDEWITNTAGQRQVFHGYDD